MASIHITTPPTSAWVIPTNQTLNVPEKGAVQFKRTYKIPTRNLKNILNGIKSGMTLGAAEGWIRGVAGTLDDAGLDSIFAPPANVDSWVVLSYYVNQITAGEYMEVQITYGWTDLDINGIFSASAWTQEEVVSQSVQWQTYSVSPYIYCNEKKHTDSKVNRAGQATVKPEDALKSKQKHINGALTNPPSQSDNDVYKWVDTSGQTYELTNAEKQIFDKVVAGVNPVFHKPIATQVTQRRSNLSSVIQWKDGVDKIDNQMTVPGWDGQFIYCGASFSTTKQTYYTNEHPEGVTIYTQMITDTWEGALSADLDFYGPNAWKFHEGPTQTRN